MTSTIQGSSNRRQPVRATRINSTRIGTSVRDEVEEEIKPEFLPGISHFTDTLSAIPKEMVRHSTMLKETDAKLYVPEQDLRTFLLTEPPSYTPLEPGKDNFTQRYYKNACAIMGSMLGSLDEKTHVLSTANEALDKLIARCESAWPLIEQEISEETRKGRLDHWAYTDRAIDKKPAANTERASRRNNEAERAAAAAASDVTNSKTSKGQRRFAQDIADIEDPLRKTTQNKRKPNDTVTGAGLGISSAGIKKRKIEKPSPLPANTELLIEKSLSSVFRSIPRSPTVSATDTRRRMKNVNGVAVNGRRRAGTTTSNVGSPMMASSPVLAAFAVPAKGGNSPALGPSMARTTSSRVRGGPTSNPHQSNRIVSAQSTPLLNGINLPDEKIPLFRSHGSFRGDENGNGDLDNRTASRSGIKREETNAKPRPPSISTATRHNGKASKTGTPTMATFPDTSRPRSGRNSTTTLNATDLIPPKRSHKKKEPAAVQRQRSQQKNGRIRDDDDSDDGDEMGEAEQLYCYCNGPSHGEMVACDMPGCEKEWFHLECVGLTKPPSTKCELIHRNFNCYTHANHCVAKWFCPDCHPKQQRLAIERVVTA